jgi:hypothetical protein
MQQACTKVSARNHYQASSIRSSSIYGQDSDKRGSTACKGPTPPIYLLLLLLAYQTQQYSLQSTAYVLMPAQVAGGATAVIRHTYATTSPWSLQSKRACSAAGCIQHCTSLLHVLPSTCLQLYGCDTQRCHALCKNSGSNPATAQ